MSPKPRQILVTSALPYANGPIHIGHMLEYVQTDIWVRFQKLRGHECIYVCADDAHGTPIMLRAQAEGISPEALIERMHKEHLQDFTDFGAPSTITTVPTRMKIAISPKPFIPGCAMPDISAPG